MQTCDSDRKVPAYYEGYLGSIPGSGRSSEEGNATYSSTLAWKIPWTEEPGSLQSTGSQRVGHHRAPSLPDSSAGKESACNAGDPGSIPGLGRSPGQGIGYPLQYFQASFVPQMVKNLPVMWETRDRSRGWEDPLEEGMLQYSCVENPMDREA